MPTESFNSFSGELINDALFACQSGVFEWQVAQQKMIVSSGLATLLGFPAGEFDGSADSFLNRLESADRERIQQKIAHLDLDKTEIEFEFRVSGSRPHWFNARGKIIRAADGQLASIIGLARELASETITARKMRIQQDALLRLLTRDKIDTLPAQEAFARITKRASRTLNLDRVSIWMYGNASQQLDNLILYDRKEQSHTTLPSLQVTDYPNYFCALQGSRALSIAYAPTDTRTHELNAGYLAPLGITSMLEAPIRRRGQTIGVVCHEHRGAQRNWTLDEQHFAASIADLVTLVLETGEQHTLLEELKYQSLHDSLTSLPNRAWLYDRLDTQLAAARGAPPDSALALLVFDINRFKEINDTLGHNVGDQILIELASRLRLAVPSATGDLSSTNSLARLSGDEFGVILHGLSDTQSLLEQAHNLLTVLHQPIQIDDMKMVVQASCGIARAPEHGQSASTLFRQADVALSRAKAEVGCRIYQPEKDHNTPRRLALMHDLIVALEQGQLDVVFQPKYALETRTLTGVEALSRWQHPRFGAVSPDEFIPLTELGGMIQPLTLHVIRRAAALWKNWHASGRKLSIAVNLSPRQFLEQNWEDTILATLQECGMPADALELEVTESAFIHEPARVRSSMEALSRHGIKFSLDDFGAGYSSLVHLSELPLHSLKIDRAFVRHIKDNPKHQAIIQSTAMLGRSLGLTVIAEGIEDESTANLLYTLGCHQGQGYHLAHPQAAEVLLATLNPITQA